MFKVLYVCDFCGSEVEGVMNCGNGWSCGCDQEQDVGNAVADFDEAFALGKVVMVHGLNPEDKPWPGYAAPRMVWAPA